MNCETAQKCIPDLRTGQLSTHQVDLLKEHLSSCKGCAAWLKNWAEICNIGKKALTPPPSLDWSSFDAAIEAELRRNPIPGRQSLSLKDFWQALSSFILNYPRKTSIRLASSVALAAAVALFFFSRPVPSDPEHGHLILGEAVISSPHGDLVTYKSSETDRGYYHEVISLNLVEGKEY
jgi:predicted anti-sigma-YlaC factor YlaD